MINHVVFTTLTTACMWWQIFLITLTYIKNKWQSMSVVVTPGLESDSLLMFLQYLNS